MSLKFDEWLIEQRNRDDFIGTFARELNIEELDRKLQRRKYNEHACWVDIVIEMQEPEYVSTFNLAWQEFLLEKVAIESQTAP